MKSSKMFLLVCALVIYGIITAVVCAAIWNDEASNLFDVAAGLLFAANAYAIYRAAKSIEKTIKENGGIE